MSVHSAAQWGKSPIFSVRLFSPLISYSESSSLSTPLPMLQQRFSRDDEHKFSIASCCVVHLRDSSL